MKPIIGLSPLYDEEKRGLWMRPGYLDVLYACGAIPLVLPFDADAIDIEQMLSLCNGLLMTGGPDVNPSLYGEERLPECGEVQSCRDELEFRLLDHALTAEVPLLGICRGAQMLNVYCGGTLYQDLASQMPETINHAMEPPFEVPCHRIELVEGTPIHQLLDERVLPVNSIHHQAIKDVAPCFSVMAHSLDGVIEGIWMPDKPFVWGVQWHPEWIWDVDARQRRIVEQFVKACSCN